jgi:hypothetical protein
MADYQLTDPATGGVIIRTEDGASIPPDPTNRDYVEYQQWVEGGGVPDPYVEPEPVPPQPSAEQQLLYDHENRLRYMEGEPPLELDDFLDKMKGG